MSLTFEEKLAIERAEMVRLIRTAKAATISNDVLPQAISAKIAHLMSEAQVEEARRVVVEHLNATTLKT
jgi:uncharacterized protein YbcI